MLSCNSNLNAEMERLIDLLLYTKHMNNLFLEKLIREEFPKGSKRQIEHILNAQHIWRSRIQGKEFINGPWSSAHKDLKEYNSNEIHLLGKEMYENPLSKLIKYSNSKGGDFSNSLDQVISHVINHGTHHRAQISFILRQESIEPIPSDYILYKRA